MTSGITLIGAGALGQGFASMLAPGGPVTLLTRESTASAMREAGAITVRVRGEAVATEVGDEPGQIRVVSDPGELSGSDALVFVTKGQHLVEIAERVSDAWRPADGVVLGLQNGVMKDRVLGEVFGADRLVGAATVLGARRDEDGTVMVTGLGQTYMGEFDGAQSERVAALAARWERAGLPVRTDLDIARLLWTKCVNALGAFGIGCLTRLPANLAMQSPAIAGVFLDILREGSLVAAAEGAPIDDFPDLPIATYVQTPRDELAARLSETVRAAASVPGAVPTYSSMAQDVIAGRPTEVDAVFGDVVRRAEKHGVDVPRLALIGGIVSGIDSLR